jgi:hypothetical protein
MVWWQDARVWSSLVGVLLGFLLSQGVEWLRRRRQRRGHWGALRAEIDFCKGLAETYRDAVYAAPLYRLPVVTYTHSLPALLGDGAVNETEAGALVQFFSEVETLNRGLDLAQAARERDDQQTIRDEHGRNLLKIQRLVELHRAARAATDAHLRS